jgi:hypothetical protein
MSKARKRERRDARRTLDDISLREEPCGNVRGARGHVGQAQYGMVDGGCDVTLNDQSRPVEIG